VSQPSTALRVTSALFIVALVGCAAPGPATPEPGTPAPAPGTPAPGPATPDAGTPAAGTPDAGTPEPGPPDGEAIVVGSTLSLTGAFGPTAAIHRIAGEQFLERLNDAGGLLGRPVEWNLLDDESEPANVADLYERLITQEGVELILGPYATPLILSAQGVAERHSMVLPQHTSVLGPLMTYRCQFPAWSISFAPNEFIPNQLFDALESLPEPPQSVAFVTNQSGSTDFVTYGQPDVDDPGAMPIAQERGLEVVAEVRYPPGTTEWAAQASQLRDANPDFIMMNSLGVESVGLIQAMEQLNYRPPLMFSLFPAPGPLLGLDDAGEGHLSVSMFEPNEPILERMGTEVREIVEEFQSRADAEGLPYTAFETQATSSWTAWEILAAGVEGAGSLDNDAICDYLIENGADTTFHGHLTFDPEQNNFWDTTSGIKQVQDGDWVMVWPEDRSAAPMRGPQN
jgi:branched-chain amino acid transport system substrate-binding protein